MAGAHDIAQCTVNNRELLEHNQGTWRCQYRWGSECMLEDHQSLEDCHGKWVLLGLSFRGQSSSPFLSKKGVNEAQESEEYWMRKWTHAVILSFLFGMCSNNGQCIPGIQHLFKLYKSSYWRWMLGVWDWCTGLLSDSGLFSAGVPNFHNFRWVWMIGGVEDFSTCWNSIPHPLLPFGRHSFVGGSLQHGERKGACSRLCQHHMFKHLIPEGKS